MNSTPAARLARQERTAAERKNRRTRSRSTLLLVPFVVALIDHDLGRIGLQILWPRPGIEVAEREPLSLVHDLQGRFHRCDGTAIFRDRERFALLHLRKVFAQVRRQLLHRNRLAHAFSIPRSPSPVNASTLRSMPASLARLTALLRKRREESGWVWAGGA